MGSVLWALLMVQVLNAWTFLDLDQTWQFLFQGLLIVVAAIVYSQVRRTGRA
jgi:ribose transport system ATP-binding protein